MNENKRLLAVFGTIIGVVVLILIISFWPKADKSFTCGIKGDKDYNKLGAINYEQYQCLMKKDQVIAIVVDKDLSKKEKKTLNDFALDANRAIYYIDFNNISKSELKTIKKDLKYADKSFEKDVILVVKKGEVKAYKEGILGNSKELLQFGEDNNLAKFACGVTGDKEYTNLGEINYEQYKCLTEKDETFALIIAQTSCIHCQNFKPVINEYVDDNNLRTYIMEIDQWSSDDKEAFMNSLEYFKDNNSWGTPLTLAIKGNQVLAELSGFTDDNSHLDAFFEEAKLK